MIWQKQVYVVDIKSTRDIENVWPLRMYYNWYSSGGSQLHCLGWRILGSHTAAKQSVHRFFSFIEFSICHFFRFSLWTLMSQHSGSINVSESLLRSIFVLYSEAHDLSEAKDIYSCFLVLH